MTTEQEPLARRLTIPDEPSRQAAYMDKVAERHRERRKKRAQHLAATRDRHERAVQAASQVTAGSGLTDILIRHQFVTGGAVDGPSPLVTAIRRPTEALATYLTAVFVAQATTKPPRTFGNPYGIVTKPPGTITTWSRLLGHYGRDVSGGAARSRVTRAFDALATADLMTIGPPNTRDRYERFTLLRDDGSDRPYTVPGRTRPGHVLSLPVEFFTAGWIHVLERREIAMLLFVLHGHQTIDHDGYIRFPEATKSRLRLSGETYAAIHELAEFGLIEIRDSMPARRGGKVEPPADDDEGPDERQRDPVPYDLQVPDDFRDRLTQPAHATVTATLSANPVPPRLGESYPFPEHPEDDAA